MRIFLNNEFLRRLALGAGLFLSIMMYTNTTSDFLKLAKPDFEKMQQTELKKTAQHGRFLLNRHRLLEKKMKGQAKYEDWLQKQRSLLESYKKAQKVQENQPLDKYIEEEVNNKTREISGPLVQKLEIFFQGQTPEGWQDYAQTTRDGKKYLLFPAEEKLLEGIGRQANPELFLTYNQGQGRQYLHLTKLPQPLAEKYAPDSLLHPWRAGFWAPFSLGLLLYLFIIPKIKRPKDALGHPRLWGTMVSDFFGLVFSGFLFLFGFLLMLEHHAGILNFSKMQTGPQIGVVVLWLLGILCFWGTMWLGISHCNFWIRILPEGLEKHTQSKTSFYAYADMEKASLKIKDYGWIKNLILLLSIFTPNTATMGLAMKDTSTILVIEMKKDRPWRLTPSNLVGGIDLVKALHKNGVPLDEKLTKALEEE